MGPLDALEDEYVRFSGARTTLRELLELIVGSVVFVLVAAGLTWYLLGESAAFVVAAILGGIFAVTILSQTYWAVRGREDYDDRDG